MVIEISKLIQAKTTKTDKLGVANWRAQPFNTGDRSIQVANTKFV